MPTITHRMELEALVGRFAFLVDPHGESAGQGIIERYRGDYRIIWGSCLQPTNRLLCLDDIADIAGNVIELKGGAA